MKTKYLIYSAITLCVMVVATAAIAYYRFLSQGEFGEKPIYAAMQALELENRSSKTPGTPIFIEDAKESGYAMLGMPSKDEKHPYVWIVLNRISWDGSLMEIPENSQVEVSCDFIENLARKTEINSDVLRHLKAICRKQG
ncbi:hypothetical protein HF908_15525 [Ralstonia pseudosolanacearum]|uniref:Uncharacterized protein n=1 Tax=Ralstonia solanacearum TaxID=305 RepID=A0AA92K387_RALSL|nr:hypothetical protein [Ralstonia pseudosolanacearum]QOK92746.1 hypothetical protein HF908_15525 [Ralstonia pseudosolanacearum]QOK97640.1 hypothetical protein HF909_15240 [Ralstonia pseudosolanacearum]